MFRITFLPFFIPLRRLQLAIINKSSLLKSETSSARTASPPPIPTPIATSTSQIHQKKQTDRVDDDDDYGNIKLHDREIDLDDDYGNIKLRSGWCGITTSVISFSPAILRRRRAPPRSTVSPSRSLAAHPTTMEALSVTPPDPVWIFQDSNRMLKKERWEFSNGMEFVEFAGKFFDSNAAVQIQDGGGVAAMTAIENAVGAQHEWTGGVGLYVNRWNWFVSFLFSFSRCRGNRNYRMMLLGKSWCSLK